MNGKLQRDTQRASAGAGPIRTGNQSTPFALVNKRSATGQSRKQIGTSDTFGSRSSKNRSRAKSKVDTFPGRKVEGPCDITSSAAENGGGAKSETG
jgi:hypothetical protein